MKITFGNEEIKKVFEVYLKEALVKYDHVMSVDSFILDCTQDTIEITVSEEPEDEEKE